MESLIGDHMDNAAIGERIRLKREALGISQGELAHAIGLCRNTIVNVENAKIRSLNLENLSIAANYLRTSEEYLLFGHDPVQVETLLQQDELKARFEEQRRVIVDEYEKRIAELQKELENVKTVNAAYLDHIRTLKQINSRNNGAQTEND